MRKFNSLFMFLLAVLVLGCGTSCASDEPKEPAADENTSYFSGKKVLVAYFSWGGTTKRMAEQIQSITGADIPKSEGPEVWYDLNGRQVYKEFADSGIYIVKSHNSVKKILKR